MRGDPAWRSAMHILNLASQAAAMKGWPFRREVNGDLRIEVATSQHRTQVVTVTMASDGDRDPCALVWSKCGEVRAETDAWALLRLNLQLGYGRVALRGQELVVLHALLDRTGDLSEVGKTVYWVGKAADDLEQGALGAYRDVL